jgi:hypothetical protein
MCSPQELIARLSAFCSSNEILPVLALLEKILDRDQYTFLGPDQANILEFLVVRLLRHGWVENLVLGFENLVCVAHDLLFFESLF